MSKRLLVIDDDPDIVEILCAIGVDQGWEVRGAFGEVAVNLAVTWQPDAITLDLRMPSLDGPAVRQLLCQNPRTAAIPVVLLTGVHIDVREETRMRVFAVIDKPFDLDLFVRVLNAAMTPE